MSVSVSTTAGNQVTVTVDGATQLSFTTEDSSISVVNGDTSSISVTNQGPKGDTGATGATGATGPQGPAGTSPNAFTTISVAGQDNVVADGVDDTLTIAGGSNVTITTNASSDTITIASTDTNTNVGNTNQSLSGTRIIDCNGEDLEIDVNGGEFTLDDTIHNYITASSNALTLQGITYPASDGSAEQIIRTNGSGVLSFRSPRGGVYSYSGYGTDVTKTSTFYYQFASATSTSSSTNMTSSFVGQAISHSTYGANGSMTLDGLSSTESATYSMTVKITTDGSVIIGTLVPASQQFVVANQVVTASASEQTFTLTQSSPTNCLDQAGKQWVLGLQVTLFTATTVDFRVEDLSITVT